MIKKLLLLTITTLFLTGCIKQAATTQRSIAIPEPTGSSATNSATKLTATDSATASSPGATLTDQDKKSSLIALTPTELAKHNNKADCWLLLDGKVYDVTAYIGQHPGGEKILAGCGQDATQLFQTKNGSGESHSEKAQELLLEYYLGKLIIQ